MVTYPGQLSEVSLSSPLHTTTTITTTPPGVLQECPWSASCPWQPCRRPPPPPIPSCSASGSRVAVRRVREYRERQRSSASTDLDYLCAAARTAHSGLRLYLLITTPSPPTPTPPKPALVPLLGRRLGEAGTFEQHATHQRDGSADKFMDHLEIRIKSCSDSQDSDVMPHRWTQVLLIDSQRLREG
ncbi:hypothetical protein O3P69_017478 [Scylla paramamosain]|uniref:Uncharacterized protein n=1 Tax=Scylla paramamosain TaxID=85552 RepID=A0AAW0TWM8_SCYPA